MIRLLNSPVLLSYDGARLSYYHYWLTVFDKKYAFSYAGKKYLEIFMEYIIFLFIFAVIIELQPNSSVLTMIFIILANTHLEAFEQICILLC